MISITADRDQDWINKSTVHNFDEAWTSVIFVPITKFTTVGYDDYFEISSKIDDRFESCENRACCLCYSMYGMYSKVNTYFAGFYYYPLVRTICDK